MRLAWVLVAVVAAFTAAGIALAWGLIVPLRRKSYRAWPLALRVPWFALLALFVGIGAFLICGLAYTEISEKRVGLGTGVLTVLILGAIKGVVLSQRPDDPPT